MTISFNEEHCSGKYVYRIFIREYYEDVILSLSNKYINLRFKIAVSNKSSLNQCIYMDLFDDIIIDNIIFL